MVTVLRVPMAGTGGALTPSRPVAPSIINVGALAPFAGGAMSSATVARSTRIMRLTTTPM